jgi:signal peptidase II
VIFAVLLIFLARMTDTATPLELAAFSLLLGGATGNLIDRVRLGHVVDYLDFYVGQYHWPAFNLADSAISIATGYLVLPLFRARPPGRQGTPARDGIGNHEPRASA